jgi:hypothetical protein
MISLIGFIHVINLPQVESILYKQQTLDAALEIAQ